MVHRIESDSLWGVDNAVAYEIAAEADYFDAKYLMLGVCAVAAGHFSR